MTMRFTEDDLRAVLDEHSAGGSPPPDVCGRAERAGRRLVHRRTSAAGGVLAVGALAVGATVAALPSAGAAGTHTAHGTHTAGGITPADGGGDPVTLLPSQHGGRQIAAVQYTYGEAMHAQLSYTPHGGFVSVLPLCTDDGYQITVSVNGRTATFGCGPHDLNRGWALGLARTRKPGVVDVTVKPATNASTKGSWAVGVYEN
ncbi:MAG: hypothetical protein ACJ73S_33375 [Mycobacteriales bacterium]